MNRGEQEADSVSLSFSTHTLSIYLSIGFQHFVTRSAAARVNLLHRPNFSAGT